MLRHKCSCCGLRNRAPTLRGSLAGARGKRLKSYRGYIVTKRCHSVLCNACNFVTLLTHASRCSRLALSRHSRDAATGALAATLGEKPKNALLVRLAQAAFGDEPRHQLPWRNVEPEVGRGARLRGQAHFHLFASVPAVRVVHLVGAAFFDRDFLQSVADVP